MNRNPANAIATPTPVNTLPARPSRALLSLPRLPIDAAAKRNKFDAPMANAPDVLCQEPRSDMIPNTTIACPEPVPRA
jgi:hypothetical protein